MIEKSFNNDFQVADSEQRWYMLFNASVSTTADLVEFDSLELKRHVWKVIRRTSKYIDRKRYQLLED